MTRSKGLLVVVSGPAGSGKGTVVRLLREMRDIALSVSATTRLPRDGERDGESYYFMSRDDFEDMVAHGEMLEYTMYVGNYYGTPKTEVERIIATGRDLILEIEVDGARQIKKLYPDAVTVMLLPPSSAELTRRLRTRGTESEEVIAERLKRAQKEIKELDCYDYVAVNKTNLERQCAEALGAIIDAEHCKRERMRDFCENFFINAEREGE